MPSGRILTTAALIGAAAGVVSDVPRGDAWSLGIAAASMLPVVTHPLVRRMLTVVTIAALFAGAGADARDRALAPPLVGWLSDAGGDGERIDHPAVVEGVLASDAERSDDGARLVIAVRAVEDGHGRHPIEGIVQAYVGGQRTEAMLPEWTAGRSLWAPMTLHRPPVWLNPGGPSLRWQALRARADLAGSIKSADLVTVRRGHWWDEAAAAVRARVRRTVQALLPDHPDSAAVIVAILIGDRSGLDPAVVRRLQAAGTYHVIAISGGNIALLVTTGMLVLRALLRKFRAVAVIVMVSVVLYAWIAGGGASVDRAAVVAVLYLACALVGLSPPPMNVLALASVLVLAASPLAIVDVSAWLSFGASFAIMFGAERLMTWIGAHWSGRPWIWRELLRAATGIFVATVCAELMLLPVGAAIFWRVGIAGLGLNFIAIPAMAVVQVAGLAAIAVAPVWHAPARGAAVAAHLGAQALMRSARVVDLVPWLTWRVPPPRFWWIAGFYGGAWVWFALQRWRRWRIAAGATAVASFVAILSAPDTFLSRPPPGWLRWSMIDVGQGDSMLVQFPEGQSLVVDAGTGTAAFNAGDRIVTPALWALGVRRLDWLAFTHADLDHIGGAAALTTTFRPYEVWEGIPVPNDGKRRALRSAVDLEGGTWRTLQAGDRFETGSVQVAVLNPSLPEWERQRVRNDDSLVLRIRYGQVELLLTGDISAEAERQLDIAEGGPPLRILKVAHHGSRTSSAPGFVDRYRPLAALVSVGRGNLFGHPSPEVIARLAQAGARVFRTDTDGAIVVETNGTTARIHTMTGERWTITAG